MSNGTGPERRTIYFGPAKNTYDSSRFDSFVRGDVFEELGKFTDGFNIEGELPILIYNFPNAQLGIEYRRISNQRCMVNLLGTPRGKTHMDKIETFIFDKDNK